MSKISEQIYLGSAQEATNKKWLIDHHISHIVNCTVEHQNYYPNVCNYLKLNLYDSPQQPLDHVLDRTYKYILDAVEKGGTVLVHCHAGVSRSATIVLYFIMKIKGWSLEEAYRYLKSKRSIINPNKGFMYQLHAKSGGVRNVQKPRRVITPRAQIHHTPHEDRRYLSTSTPRMIESRGMLYQRFGVGVL